MLKIANVSKVAAVSVIAAASTLTPASVVSASTAPSFVPNTTSCYQQPVSKTVNNGEFTAKWNGDNTFTINVTKAPNLDIQLYASSYHLTNPAYKGGCFSYDTSKGTSPQTYDNNTQTIFLKAGVTGTQTVTLVMPTTCYNEQADLYFGDKNGQPLNADLGQYGHDGYNMVAGNIMTTDKNPACVGGKGGVVPTTPATTNTPVVEAASTVQPTLSDTGTKTTAISLVATVLLATAGLVFTRRSKANN